MNYLDYFGLHVEPFSNVAIAKFYYNSPRHSRALAKLTYAVDSMKGLALLVGNIGAGKTTLARKFLDSLSEERYEASLIVMVHSSVTADWLLKKIAHQMGIEDPSPDKLKLIGQLYERLVSIRESGKKAVVIVDEAQMLHSREIMEEFRGLLNLEVDERKLLTFVLFGLPEINENLKLDEPLAQRVAIRINLDSMDAEETDHYIKHRLSVAGSGNILFTNEAIDIIFKASSGIPRLINTISDNALLEAFIVKKQEITDDIILNVVEDLGLELKHIPPRARPTEPVKKEPEETKRAEENDDIESMFQGLLVD